MLFGPCFRSVSISNFGINTSGAVSSVLAVMVYEATNKMANVSVFLLDVLLGIDCKMSLFGRIGRSDSYQITPFSFFFLPFLFCVLFPWSKDQLYQL